MPVTVVPISVVNSLMTSLVWWILWHSYYYSCFWERKHVYIAGYQLLRWI